MKKTKQFLFIYDDSFPKSEIIKDIIGEKGFSDVLVKRKTLFDYYKEGSGIGTESTLWLKVGSVYAFEELNETMLDKYGDDFKVIHCISNYIISDQRKVARAFDEIVQQKDVTRGVVNGKTALIFFPNIKEYSTFIDASLKEDQLPCEFSKNIENTVDCLGFTDISIISNFITCITGNFDSRYFNALTGDDYVINKSSTNKKKILSEYTYYRLLPDDMKYWFVMPFDYREQGDKATYSMERLHMTDLAIKWVHGSIDEKEFNLILDKYFHFFNARHKKSVSEKEYRATADKLYVDKVEERIEQLKALPEYKKIEKILDSATEEGSIDNIYKKYVEIKNRVEAETEFQHISVIGHGDSCFANALYNKSTRTLKLIDPKGALNDKDLWTDPYYDIAKLSHSICGRYDFFNNALFEITVDESMHLDLDIPFDNLRYIELFKEKLRENRFDYRCVRVYEASLFLSMLPLHIDYPHKVLGFILNALNILKEVQNDV
ncbi:MAG: hypothetical protein E7305_00400 [Butyrivibrio sp.]|nr:hypothetical protein [Butyrivibrio sp.]